MFTANEIKEAKDLLNEIIKADSRFEYFNRNREYAIGEKIRRDGVYARLEDIFADYDIHFAFGATRMVIVVGDKYVLKTNKYEPEYSAWKDYYYDYCQIEYDTYNKIKEEAFDEDLRDCFAECIKLTDDYPYSWYLMEYCEPDEDYVSDCGYDNYHSSSNYDEDCSSYNYDVDYSGPEMTYSFLQCEWGTDLFEIFESFCDKFDICDLHTANLGKNRDGWWKIIDYASYHG